jgi:hypothetical protein
MLFHGLSEQCYKKSLDLHVKVYNEISLTTDKIKAEVESALHFIRRIYFYDF